MEEYTIDISENDLMELYWDAFEKMVMDYELNDAKEAIKLDYSEEIRGELFLLLRRRGVVGPKIDDFSDVLDEIVKPLWEIVDDEFRYRRETARLYYKSDKKNLVVTGHISLDDKDVYTFSCTCEDDCEYEPILIIYDTGYMIEINSCVEKGFMSRDGYPQWESLR